MRRLAPLDRALLLILVPLWSLAFALHLDALARGRLAWVPLVVTAPQNEHEYPIAREASGPAQGWDAGDVRVGDHILRLGDADLRGVGQLGFIARALEAAGPDLRVPLSLQRGTEPVEGWLNLRPIGFGWRFSILTLPFIVLAAFLVLRLPGSPLARAIFLACMAHAFHWTPRLLSTDPQRNHSTTRSPTARFDSLGPLSIRLLRSNFARRFAGGLTSIPLGPR